MSCMEKYKKRKMRKKFECERFIACDWQKVVRAEWYIPSKWYFTLQCTELIFGDIILCVWFFENVPEVWKNNQVIDFWQYIYQLFDCSNIN